MERYFGTIRFYSRKEGFGFIRSDDQKHDYFFRLNDVEEELRDRGTLTNIQVSFVLVSYFSNGGQRVKAMDVKPIPVSEEEADRLAPLYDMENPFEAEFGWDHYHDE